MPIFDCCIIMALFLNVTHYMCAILSIFISLLLFACPKGFLQRLFSDPSQVQQAAASFLELTKVKVSHKSLYLPIVSVMQLQDSKS